MTDHANSIFSLFATGMLIVFSASIWLSIWQIHHRRAVPKVSEEILEPPRLGIEISNLDWLRLRLLLQQKTVTFSHGQPKKRVRPRTIRCIRHKPTAAVASKGPEEWIEFADKFENFLELPREIRNIIYEHVMSAFSTRCILLSVRTLSLLTVYPHILPSFCFANKQLHHEGIHAWLLRTRVIIPSGQDLLNQFQAFLINHDGFKAVRMLSFLNLDEYGPERWTLHPSYCPSLLAADCLGLRKLSIEIKTTKLLSFGLSLATNSIEYQLKSIKDIEHELTLAPLFKLQCLRQITVSVAAPKSYAGLLVPLTTYTGEDIMTNLRNAVKEGFEKAGKTSQVRIDFDGIIWHEILF